MFACSSPQASNSQIYKNLGNLTNDAAPDFCGTADGEVQTDDHETDEVGLRIELQIKLSTIQSTEIQYFC